MVIHNKYFIIQIVSSASANSRDLSGRRWMDADQQLIQLIMFSIWRAHFHVFTLRTFSISAKAYVIHSYE